MYATLETERTTLKPFETDDYASVFELICAFKQQNEGEHFSDIQTLEDAKRINDETVKTGNEWLILHKETGTPLGWVMCDKAMGHKITKRAFVHAWIRDEYRHMGLGGEILKSVMNFGFYGIQTENVVTNVVNRQKKAYQLMQDLGFTVYNHFPKTKVIDDSTTIQFKISKSEYVQQSYAFVGVYDYTPPVKAASPYSYKNPIRVIDSIQFIQEPNGYQCGQSVIAMLAGVTVDEVVAVIENDKGTPTPMMRDALKYYGIKAAKRLKYTEGDPLPSCCILSLQLPEYGHWSLYYKGMFYDPEFGVLEQLPPQAKLRYVWEILETR